MTARAQGLCVFACLLKGGATFGKIGQIRCFGQRADVSEGTFQGRGRP